MKTVSIFVQKDYFQTFFTYAFYFNFFESCSSVISDEHTIRKKLASVAARTGACSL